MTAAALRHAAPLLNIRAPIFAGMGAAGLFAITIVAVAIFGDGQFDAPSARERVGPLPQAHSEPAQQHAAQTHNPISFQAPSDGHEASLAGVNEGFETRDESAAQPAPAEERGSDPAAAEAHNAAASAVPNPNALRPVPFAGDRKSVV